MAGLRPRSTGCRGKPEDEEPCPPDDDEEEKVLKMEWVRAEKDGMDSGGVPSLLQDVDRLMALVV